MTYNELLNEYKELREMLVGYFMNNVYFNFNSLKKYIDNLENVRASNRSTLKIAMIYSMINKMENTESIDLTLRLFVEYDEICNIQSNILNELSMTCMLANKGDLNKIYIVSMR